MENHIEFNRDLSTLSEREFFIHIMKIMELNQQLGAELDRIGDELAARLEQRQRPPKPKH